MREACHAAPAPGAAGRGCEKLLAMSPLGSADDADEQSATERAEVARRYRARRTEELLALARQAGLEEPLAVGEFSTVPLEDFAAIPFVGAFAAAIAAARGHRHGLPNGLMLAVQADSLVAIERDWTATRSTFTPREVRRWPRSELSVAEIDRRSLKTRVRLAIAGEEKPLVLYTTSLRINPWAAAVLRALGAQVPELVLGAEDPPDTASSGQGA
jgi:hypothetical protein